jgi:hypothetical protein
MSHDVTLDVNQMQEKTIKQKTEISVCLFILPFPGMSSAIVGYDVVTSSSPLLVVSRALFALIHCLLQECIRPNRG